MKCDRRWWNDGRDRVAEEKRRLEKAEHAGRCILAMCDALEFIPVHRDVSEHGSDSKCYGRWLAMRIGPPTVVFAKPIGCGPAEYSLVQLPDADWDAAERALFQPLEPGGWQAGNWHEKVAS